MNAPRSRRSQGMSLIEVMVAMAIFAVVAGLLYGAFAQTARNKERIERQLDREHEIRGGIERMAQELSNAYASAHKNVNTALRPNMTGLVAKQQGSSTRVNFTSFSHRRLYRNAHESDQNELGYYVTQDPEHPGQEVLARREQRRIDDDLEKGGQSQVLISNVKTFELSFLDPLTNEWSESWDTTQISMQPNRMPAQAKILVTVPNLSGSGPDQVFGTRTFFPNTYALNFTLYHAQ